MQTQALPLKHPQDLELVALMQQGGSWSSEALLNVLINMDLPLSSSPRQPAPKPPCEEELSPRAQAPTTHFHLNLSDPQAHLSTWQGMTMEKGDWGEPGSM